MNPPPTSLPITTFWVIPMHQPQACCILRLDSILKSRDTTLPTKIRPVKAVVYPVVVYGCESWTMKKAERQRIDAFELWLKKTLESPLDCKEIQPFHPKGKQS